MLQIKRQRLTYATELHAINAGQQPIHMCIDAARCAASGMHSTTVNDAFVLFFCLVFDAEPRLSATAEMSAGKALQSPPTHACRRFHTPENRSAAYGALKERFLVIL